MLARSLHTRDDLIRRLQCPTTACERALADGIVTVLGSFTAPGDFPFYLVQVESARGSVWYVGLKIDEKKVRYVPFWLNKEDIPWEHWAGRPDGGDLLRDGDLPEWCYFRRDYERTKP